MNWNFSEAIYQLGAGPTADRTALVHDDEIISFAELRRRAVSLADWLMTLGLPAGSHIGHYMRNSNAYMETFFGAGLAGMSHVNVNYRYLDEELVDLANGLDIRVLVYDREFADRVSHIRDQLKVTVAFLEVGKGKPVNDFAVAYDEVFGRAVTDFSPQTSPDDLILIATGGTTGLPKGTQWRHEDLWYKTDVGAGGAMMALGLESHPETIEEHVANVAKLPVGGPLLPLCPLMHGTGLLVAMMVLAQGGPVLTVSGTRFDPDKTADRILQHGVSSLVIVGDAIAIPLLEVFQRRSNEDILQTVAACISSGSILSDESKAGFRALKPELMLIDTLGSSEAVGFGLATEEAGVFAPMPTTRVLDDDLKLVEPGSGVIGIAYSSGYTPIGYYNEPEKSAETFVVIDGVRHVKTGDRCTVREDGMLVLLGRDSSVINTGGEKVYTVEVERVLLDYPDITDALVVGLPHPRFGKMVVAVVESGSADAIDAEAVRAFCHEHLADYKVPKHVFLADSLQRAANGKADYPFVTDFAAKQLAALP